MTEVSRMTDKTRHAGAAPRWLALAPVATAAPARGSRIAAFGIGVATMAGLSATRRQRARQGADPAPVAVRPSRGRGTREDERAVPTRPPRAGRSS